MPETVTSRRDRDRRPSAVDLPGAAGTSEAVDQLLEAGFALGGVASDVPMLEGRRATVGDRRVAVFRLPSGFAAVDAACPHRGGPLSDGIVADGCVTCPLHNWRLDLLTGTVVGRDERMPLHEVVEHDGRLYVRLAPEARGDAAGGDAAAGGPAPVTEEGDGAPVAGATAAGR